ncbi:pheromone-processing carboxypeptidase KEX1-like [Leguminivora glycinivorella]|uniref:pheromone-processing carboxypeptidase KEX1-like n=1 Tax=Leguminivora glycinivorella TaxID=1035111 RepID=UPI00200F7FD1|nr:pheromone-processing carboxypeptidase KEX1-like [Leguminivora glycinivorella]
MKISIFVIVVVAITTQTTYIESRPYLPRIQIYEIRENPEWKDDSYSNQKTKTAPATLLPGLDLDHIDKPKILILPIRQNQKLIPDIFKQLIGNAIQDKNEEIDTDTSHEVRKMIFDRYEGDTSVSDEDDAGRDDGEKYDSDTSDDDDDGNDISDGNDDDEAVDDNDIASEPDNFVDETRSRSRMRRGKKTMLRKANTNNVLFYV